VVELNLVLSWQVNLEKRIRTAVEVKMTKKALYENILTIAPKFLMYN
jgi:hypothetical protein